MAHDFIEKLQQHAAKGGLQVRSVAMIERDGTGSVGTLARAAFGGSVEADTIYLLHCATPGGAAATLFQPTVKRIQLPGEFHATVAGAAPQALEVRGGGFFHRETPLRYVLSAMCVATIVLIPLAIYLLFFYGRPKLVGANGKAVILGPGTTAALKRLRFSASFGRGKIFPKWLLQVSPNGDGTTDCVMSAADYGGFVAKDPGFGVFAALCQALSTELPRGSGTAAQPLQPPKYQTQPSSP